MGTDRGATAGAETVASIDTGVGLAAMGSTGTVSGVAGTSGRKGSDGIMSLSAPPFGADGE